MIITMTLVSIHHLIHTWKKEKEKEKKAFFSHDENFQDLFSYLKLEASTFWPNLFMKTYLCYKSQINLNLNTNKNSSNICNIYNKKWG